jgi:hypothetical protein
MSREFRVLVRESLLKAGLSGASEVLENEQSSGFEDSESIWTLGNLRLRFIEERGQHFVDIGSGFCKSRYFIFDDLALLMRWRTLDEIIHTEEPIELSEALRLVKDELETLDEMFSKERLDETSAKLQEVSEAKGKARYG